ncbi:MAG TPA: hypothetical protein VFR58_10450 [Flavisolibacter sp.]|nr:hypothetical protein [Flavisolibacter sp.]
MKYKYMLLCLSAFLPALVSCDKQNEDLETPLKDFPQVIRLSDEGDGDLEDEDGFSFAITLSDRTDPDGEELGGRPVPLAEKVRVNFAVTDFEGFAQLSDYLGSAEAFYEIDDCTTSLDQNIDLNLQFDVATGRGSVDFPAGVEEIEIEFEANEDLFDDNILNSDERSITIRLTGLEGNPQGVAVNTTASFVYEVQDDEAIYGEWELDLSDAVAFARFKSLFGLINEDIRSLQASDVDEITLSFEYGEVKALVVLNEMEQVDDCGTMVMENKEIEIEAEIEELTDDALDGDLEFGETLELAGGVFREFVYKGSFVIVGDTLQIELEGEFGDERVSPLVLILSK